MLVEWIRRHDDKVDRHLRTYLFTDKPITDVERESDGDSAQPDQAD